MIKTENPNVPTNLRCDLVKYLFHIFDIRLGKTKLCLRTLVQHN